MLPNPLSGVRRPPMSTLILFGDGPREDGLAGIRLRGDSCKGAYSSKSKFGDGVEAWSPSTISVFLIGSSTTGCLALMTIVFEPELCLSPFAAMVTS